MIYEIIYPFAVLAGIVCGGLLIVGLWFWHWYAWHGFVDRVVVLNDSVFYWVVDKLLGRHETINKENGNE